MVKRHNDLDKTIKTMRETMKAAKKRINSTEVLLNFTYFRPIILKETRWSGKYLVLKRLGQIHDAIIEASVED